MKKQFYLLIFLIINLDSYSQLSWLQLPDFPGGKRCGVASFSINNKGYMGLGTDTNNNYYTDWYEYDPVLNIWTQKQSLPIGIGGRAYCVSFSIGSKGYVISGELNNSRSKEVIEYDPISNSWTIKAPMPGDARMNAVGFCVNDLGYFGTGYNGSVSLTDFYAFDPVTNSWSTKASFPGIARNSAVGFSVGNKGYLGMGSNTGSTFYPNDFYEYDPSNDMWSPKADFPLPWINSPTTYSSSNSGYVLCGYFLQHTGITHNPMNMLYKYTPATDSWMLTGTFPGLPRGYSGGFSLTNDIYIGVGAQTNGGNPRFYDFWKLSNGITLSLDEINNPVDFILSPNPASRYIYIGDLGGKHPEYIRIYDINGKLTGEQSIKDFNQAIDVSSYSHGIYFAELITKEGKILDGKFLKE